MKIFTIIFPFSVNLIEFPQMFFSKELKKSICALLCCRLPLSRQRHNTFDPSLFSMHIGGSKFDDGLVIRKEEFFYYTMQCVSFIMSLFICVSCLITIFEEILPVCFDFDVVSTIVHPFSLWKSLSK